MSEEFTLKFKAEIEGREDIARFFDQSGRDADRFSARLQGSLRGASQAISAFASKAGSELQAFAGRELGGSLGSNARGVLQLRDAISALAVSSGRGGEIVGSLKEQIQKTATAANQLQGNVTEALQAFVEKTGDLDTARKNIELYGKAATATGAAVKDLALVGVELSDKLGIKNQASSFAILATQAKAGAIELKDLATKGPRIFSVAASAGATGERGLREAGALAQVYAKAFGGSGTAASVATAIENTFSEILKKSAKLEAVGVKVQGRDQFEVLKDIVRATGGDKQKLLEVFGQRSIRGVDVLAREFRQTGGFGTFDKFRDVTADPDVLARDFATRNATGEAKLRAAQVSRQRFFDRYLGGIAEFGAEHANELQVGTTLLGLGGKGLGVLGRLGGAVGGSVGGALAAAGAQRVYVVNWPGGIGGGLPGGGALGNVSQFLGAAGVGLALGAAGGLYLDKHSETARGFYNAESRALGKLTGQDRALAGIEQAGVDLNTLQLQRRKAERDALTRSFEAKGLSHGAALNAADAQMKAEVKNLTVIINGDEAHAEDDSGTRSPKVMVRRGGGG